MKKKKGCNKYISSSFIAVVEKEMEKYNCSFIEATEMVARRLRNE